MGLEICCPLSITTLGSPSSFGWISLFFSRLSELAGQVPVVWGWILADERADGDQEDGQGPGDAADRRSGERSQGGRFSRSQRLASNSLAFGASHLKGFRLLHSLCSIVLSVARGTGEAHFISGLGPDLGAGNLWVPRESMQQHVREPILPSNAF